MPTDEVINLTASREMRSDVHLLCTRASDLRHLRSYALDFGGDMTDSQSSRCRDTKTNSLKPPAQTALPLFVYGSLRPNELAFTQIAHFVGSASPITISGQLFLRDGLPLFQKPAAGSAGSAGSVRGYLLSFHEQTREAAYQRVCEFEPRSHYRWDTVSLPAGGKANVLVGVKPTLGSVVWEEDAWSSSEDPVFEHAVKLIRGVATVSAVEAFQSAPSESFDWPRFFTLQMAYLLLWSAIERFTALSYGPAFEPGHRLRELANDPRLADLLQVYVKRDDQVTDTRDPGQKYKLSGSNPKASILYYYQIRNNLSHRGKGAFRDAEKVRLSLNELLSWFEAVLATAQNTTPDIVLESEDANDMK